MLMRLAALDAGLGCLRHLCAAGDGIVLYQVALIIEGVELILFVVGDAVAPHLYLVDGIFYFVGDIRIVGTVHSHIARVAVSSDKLFLGPRLVVVGSAKLRVTGLVLRVVYHLAWYCHSLSLIPVVAIDISLFELALDESLPVRNERVLDICLWEDELRVELLSYGDTILYVELIGAVVLLVDAKHASLAEEQVGGATDIGVATLWSKAHRREVYNH